MLLLLITDQNSTKKKWGIKDGEFKTCDVFTSRSVSGKNLDLRR